MTQFAANHACPWNYEYTNTVSASVQTCVDEITYTFRVQSIYDKPGAL